MRSLSVLGLLVALSPAALAGIERGNLGKSNNPGIYLDTRGVENVDDENDWQALRFVISAGVPDGKRLASSSDSVGSTDEDTSDYELKGAYCSYLVTDWFALPATDVYHPFNFGSWSQEKQLENTKDFLSLDYQAKEDAENKGYSSDESTKEACDTSWTQKRAIRVVHGLHYVSRDVVEHGLKHGYPIGTRVYISTGTHAIGVRVMSADNDAGLAVYDPNLGKAYTLPRDAADSPLNEGKTFLVAKP
ncbi:MAG TPA: hypothetical protein VL463_14120 [Kofleriaceae bacterium]|nr:hypothetical protein [Kofleriaceae bacterium]